MAVVAFRVRAVWTQDAACRSAPVNLFFPGEGYRGKYEEAEKVCMRCRVIDQCFEWAIAHEEHGYWAGTSENERRRIRRFKALAQHSTIR